MNNVDQFVLNALQEITDPCSAQILQAANRVSVTVLLLEIADGALLSFASNRLTLNSSRLGCASSAANGKRFAPIISGLQFPSVLRQQLNQSPQQVG